MGRGVGGLDEMEGKIDSYLQELKDQLNIEEKTFFFFFYKPTESNSVLFFGGFHTFIFLSIISIKISKDHVRRVTNAHNGEGCL